MTRLTYPFDNWTEDESGFWRRDVEGRKSLWYAVVWRDSDLFHAKVTKKGYLSPRENRHRLSCLPEDPPLPSPDNEWRLRPCLTREEAIRSVEEYIAVRCNPATWRGPLSEEARRVLDLAVDNRQEDQERARRAVWDERTRKVAEMFGGLSEKA